MAKGPVCNLLTGEMEAQAKKLSSDLHAQVYPLAVLAAHNHFNYIGKAEPDYVEIKNYIQNMLSNRAKEAQLEKFYNKDGKRSSSIVNVAPFRDTELPSREGLSDEEYKKKKEDFKKQYKKVKDNYIETAGVVAEMLGLKIESFRDNDGYWESKGEPSFTLEFGEKQKLEKAEEIELFTALMSDLGYETQNSALIVNYDDISPDDDSESVSDEYSLSFGTLSEEVSEGLNTIVNDYLKKHKLVGYGYTHDTTSGEMRFIIGRKAYTETAEGIRERTAEDEGAASFSPDRNFLGSWVELNTEIIKYLKENNVEATPNTVPVHATFLGSGDRGTLYEKWLEGKNQEKLTGNLRNLIIQAKRRAEKRFIEESAKQIKEDYAREANPEDNPLDPQELNDLNVKYAQRILDAERAVGHRLLMRPYYGTKDNTHYINLTISRNIVSDLDVDEAEAKMRQLFSRKTFNERVDYMARSMHNRLGSVVADELANTEALIHTLISKAEDAGRPLNLSERHQYSELSRRRMVLSDWENNISAAINIVSLDKIIASLQRSIAHDSLTASEEKAKKFDLLLQNFDLMLPSVLRRFANLEAIELGKEVSQDSDDDETGSYASGNEGWGVEAHTRDSFLGIAGTVRHALANCQLYTRTADGGYDTVKDDIDFSKYIDPKDAYQRIHEYLSKMTEESDFYDESTEDVYGTPFKALAKMRDIPGNEWVIDVIDYLETYPEAVPLFYNAFNEDHVKFLNVTADRGFGVANALGSGEALFNDAELAYDRGLTDENSIWDASGALVEEKKIKELIDDCDKLINRINLKEPNEDQYLEIIELATKLFRSIGANVSEDFVVAKAAQLGDKTEKSNFLVAAKKVSQILTIAKNASNRNFDIFSGARQRYIELGNALGYSNGVSIADSFRDAGNTYWSYRKPSKISSTIKSLANLNESQRRQYIERVFKSDYNYYDEFNDMWGCPTIAALYEGDTELAENIELAAFNSFEGKTYKKMKSPQVQMADIMGFFATKGAYSGNRWFSWYHVPPYSNAPTTDYIKLERFHGDGYEEEIKERMALVVKQELRRIRIGQLRKDRVESGELKEIARWDKNSTKFCIVPFFNTYQNADGKYLIDLLKDTGEYEGQEIDDFIFEGLDAYFYKACDADIAGFPLEDISFLRYVANENGFMDDKGNISKTFADNAPLLSREQILAAIANPDAAANDVVRAVAQTFKNYTLNQHYALSQIIQLTTADLATYKQNDLGVDWVKRFKGVHASGESMYTGAEYGKKFSAVINLSDSHYVSNNYASISASVEHARQAGRISKSLANFILSAYEDMNVTDGQSFRTLESMRSVLSMRGLWKSETMDPAYDRLLAGEFSMEDLEVIFGAVKPFIEQTILTQSGVRYGDLHPVSDTEPEEVTEALREIRNKKVQIGIETQYKDSEAVLMSLLPYVRKALGLTETSSKLAGLQRFMQENNIDIAKFESSGKVGQQGTIDINFSPSWWNSLGEDDKEALYSDYASVAGNPPAEVPTELEMKSMANIFRQGLLDSLKAGRISQEKYNEEIARMEPTEDEVYDALKRAVFLAQEDAPEGITPVSNPNDKNSIANLNPEVVKFVDNSYYRIVQPTREHFFDSEVVLGVQYKNLVTADLPEMDNFITISGKNNERRTFSSKETRSHFNALLVENLIEDFKKLAKTFSSIEAFHAALVQQLKNSPNISEDILAAVSLQSVKDAAGADYTVFRTPFSDPAIARKLSEIVLSMFKNRIAKQKMFGGAAVIETGWDYMYNYNGQHLGRVVDENGNLKGYECLLPAWSKKFFLKYLNDDGSFDHEMMAKEHPELMRMVGYRIPTDHKHSMVPLIVKGFLPASKANTIIISEDAIVAAGEDKDIDKKYLLMPKFYIKGLAQRREEFKKAYLAEMKSKGSIYADRLNRDDVDIAIDQLINGQVEVMDDGAAKSVLQFYLDNTDEFGNPEIQKVTYNPNARPQDMSRDQRDNMLFDMAYQILLHEDIQEQALTPTNFETVRYVGNLQTVIDGTNASEMSYAQARSVASGLLAESRETIADRSGALESAMYYDPLSPTNTYRHHKANMDALDLVAIFAANTTVNAKYQGTESLLHEDRKFKVNGTEINTFAALRDTDGTLVSQHFSEFINAATDNGKDPTIGKFGVTLDNAGFVCTALSMGLTPKTIALLLKQKHTYYEAKKLIGNALYEHDKALRPKDTDLLMEGVTDNELASVLLLSDKIDILLGKLKKNNGSFVGQVPGESATFSPDDIDLLRTVLKINLVYNNIVTCSAQYTKRMQVSRADGTAGAIAHTIGGAIVQMRDVARYKYETEQRKVLQTAAASPRNFDERLLIGDLTDSEWDSLRKELNNSGLPATQAAYIFGIQAAKVLMGRYFPQFSTETIDVVNDVLDNCAPSSSKEDEIAAANSVLASMTTYALAGTDLFGDDGEHTMAEKRDYYIYQFPKDYEQILKYNREIKTLLFFNSIRMENGILVLNNSGKMSSEFSRQITSDLDALFLGEIMPKNYIDKEGNTVPLPSHMRALKKAIYNKLAKDMLMYSYYTGQLSWGAKSIGNRFSDTFKHGFPEYVEALRTISDRFRTDAQKERFMDQLFSLGKGVAAKQVDYNPQYEALDGSNDLVVPMQACINSIGSAPAKYINVIQETYSGAVKSIKEDKYKLIQIKNVKNIDDNGNEKDVILGIYTPLVTLRSEDGVKFNPNMDFEELSEYVFDEERWEKHKKATESRKGKRYDAEVDEYNAFNDHGVPEEFFDSDSMESIFKAYEKAGYAVSESIGSEKQQNNFFTYDGTWTRESVANDPETLYIFTDNTDRDSGSGVISDNSWYSKKYGTGHHYPTKTSAVIRGLDNAFPVSTQHWYNSRAKGAAGRWTDADLETFKTVVDDEFNDIINAWNTGKYKRVVVPSGDGLFNGSISAITKERTPELYKYLQEKVDQLKSVVNSSSAAEEQENVSTVSSVKKVISGGQTGVDTIGLRVARRLGRETGGTAPKGFRRETGIDEEDISSYGLVEITDEEQQRYTDRTGKDDPYTARTDLNVRNSDGTVYFSTDSDSKGMIATRRSAQEYGKPFILNPSASELRKWISDNNIETLNVAGNRGSKTTDKFRKDVDNILSSALENRPEVPTQIPTDFNDAGYDFAVPDAPPTDIPNYDDGGYDYYPDSETEKALKGVPDNEDWLAAAEAAADAAEAASKEDYPDGPNDTVKEKRC